MTNITTIDALDYINACLNALKNQLQIIDYQIVFDYENDENDENEFSLITSSILTLLDDEGKTLYEYESNEITSENCIKELFTAFINETKEFILKASESSKCEIVYVVNETDAWNSTNNRKLKGVFNSLLLALWEIQLEYRDVLTDFSGFYKSVREDLDLNTSFDGIDIEQIELNTTI